MWYLIKSEVSYLTLLLVIIIGLIPATFYLENTIEDFSNMPLLALMFILVQNWNTMRNKERREFKIFLLPVSLLKISMARISIVAVYCLIIITEYELLSIVFPYQPISYKIPSSALIGIILLGFSSYFILRDLLLYFFRRIGLTAQRMIMILVIAGVGFNILGVYAFIEAKQSNSRGIIGKIIDTIIAYNPFRGEYGAYKFLMISLFFALLTLLIYPKRKAYLE